MSESEATPRVTFTPEQKAAIRKLASEGYSPANIARKIAPTLTGEERVTFWKQTSRQMERDARASIRKPVQVTTLDCMTCGRPFRSWDRKANRRCHDCKARST